MLGSGGTPAGGQRPLLSWMYISSAIATCRMLLLHWTTLACRRALLSAGSSTLISTAMMPITTRSSTSVKARRVFEALIGSSARCAPGTSERARTDSRDNRPKQTSMPTEAVRGARWLDQLWRNQHPNRQLAGARDAIDQPLDRPAADFIRPQVDRRRAWAQHRQP